MVYAIVGKPQPAYELFAELEDGEYSSVLERANRCSEMTIPTLLPRKGHRYADSLESPWQSTGARITNSLASRLLLSLLPLNIAFFKLRIDPLLARQLTGSPDVETEVNERLSVFERKILLEIEQMGLRTSVFEMLRHSIVTGNSLYYLPKKGAPRNFSLDRYRIQRDGSGNVLCIAICETIGKRALWKSAREALSQSKRVRPTNGQSNSGYKAGSEEEYELYTVIERKHDDDDDQDTYEFESHQEIEDVPIEGTYADYNEKTLPWIPIRYHHVSGESYGRSAIGDYFGSLTFMEGLTRSLFQGASASAAHRWLVDPSGLTSRTDLEKSENGWFVPGRMADVGSLQLGKVSDFSWAAGVLKEEQREVLKDFFLNQARDSERTTAEEIRMDTQQTDASLGGPYATHEHDFLRRAIPLVMERLYARKEAPTIEGKRVGEGAIIPQVVTGLEAIGRGQELSRLDMMFGMISKYFGPEALTAFKTREAFGTIGLAAGVDTEPILKDRQQIAAEAEQLRMSQLAQSIAPDVVQQLGQMAQKQIPEAQPAGV